MCRRLGGLRRADPAGAPLRGQGGDARHRARPFPPAPLAGAVPPPHLRGLQGRAHGRGLDRALRPLRGRPRDRRTLIYASLRPSGVVAAQRRTGLRELLAVVADAEDRRLPPLARELLRVLAEHLRGLEERTAEVDRRLVAAARDGGACERLAAVPGIGPVVATALAAAVGDAKTFASGRHLAAWLGLVPRQHSSGGKERLLGISKRGDGYLRRQLVHGAGALVAVSEGREGGLWSWVNALLARRPFNVVVAAVANKLARIAWVLLSRGEDYRATAA